VVLTEGADQETLNRVGSAGAVFGDANKLLVHRGVSGNIFGESLTGPEAYREPRALMAMKRCGFSRFSVSYIAYCLRFLINTDNL
jgi:hypothetical protein